MAKRKQAKVGNRELAVAMQEKRRSHAAGSHDSRPHRMRSRHASRRAAISDSKEA